MSDQERFERLVECTAAYDLRNTDPNKNYGVRGVEMCFVLKGEKGAVNFTIYTNWHLPSVTHKGEPLPADRGYHSPVAMYDGQPIISDSCPYLDGKPCYYDGSGLAAEGLFQVLLTRGSDGVWEELEAYYHSTFDEDAS